MHNKSFDDAFTKTGFSNWKKALEKFAKHQSSLSHRDAMDLVVGKNRDVSEMLRVACADERAENRRMLQIILSSIHYLGR